MSPADGASRVAGRLAPERATAVVAALPEELAPLVKRATVTRQGRAGSIRFREGRLGAAPVLLAHTGDGRERASRGLTELLAARPARRVIVIGISGGLSPRLHPGALLVGASVHDGRPPVPAPDPAWAREALGLGGAREATVLCGDRILCTPAAKAEALTTVSGAKGPVVIDLESAAFARVAARQGLPYLVVRSVCDPAEEMLPFDLNLCVGGHGGISRSRVLRHALMHPTIIGDLWELRRRVALCARELAGFVERLLDPGRKADR